MHTPNKQVISEKLTLDVCVCIKRKREGNEIQESMCVYYYSMEQSGYSDYYSAY